MTQEPYKVRIQNRGNLEVVVHGFKIVVIDREFMTYLEYRHSTFIMSECGEHVFDRRIFQIASKEDIQRAGIWDLVVNKDELPRGEQQKSLIPTLKIFENCIAGL